MANATIYVVTRQFGEDFANFLILVETDEGKKYKIYRETDGNTVQVELEANHTVLSFIEKYGCNAHIYTSPNITNWANGNWKATKDITIFFVQRVSQLKEKHDISFTRMPKESTYDCMVRYLESRKRKEYLEYGI